MELTSSNNRKSKFIKERHLRSTIRTLSLGDDPDVQVKGLGGTLRSEPHAHNKGYTSCFSVLLLTLGKFRGSSPPGIYQYFMNSSFLRCKGRRVVNVGLADTNNALLCEN
jgi:hypothetical protein